GQNYCLGQRNTQLISERIVEKLGVCTPPKRIVDDRSATKRGIFQVGPIERNVLGDPVNDDRIFIRLVLDHLIDSDGLGYDPALCFLIDTLDESLRKGVLHAKKYPDFFHVHFIKFSTSLVKLDGRQIVRKHLSPNRPVMLPILPDVKPMGNAFLLELRMKLQVGIKTDVPIRGPKDDVHVPKLMILESGQIFQRTIVEDVIVLVPVHKTSNVEGATHAEDVAHIPRMSECEICSMVSAKTATRHCNFCCARIEPYTLYQFVADHLIIGHVLLDTLMGMVSFVIKALLVVAFRAKYLDQPLLNEPLGLS